MGEAKRRAELGLMPRSLQQGEGVAVDLTNAVQKVCGCGCKYFIPTVTVYTISAILSPTGQELLAQKPVLVCMACKAVME